MCTIISGFDVKYLEFMYKPYFPFLYTLNSVNQSWFVLIIHQHYFLQYNDRFFKQENNIL